MRWMVLLALAVWLPAGMAAADSAALAAVNAARAEARQAPVVYDPRLEMIARAHGQDMVRRGFFSHTGSDGSSVGDRLRRGGVNYCFAAENIARGQGSVAAVMASWMTSPGHKRNILHRKARAVGLARTDGNTWVMVLSAPC